MTRSEDAAGTAPIELPRPMALLWGLAPEGERGPKRGLTLEQILDTAIALADAEGASALSMSRIAKELGFTAMSLYRYVDSKQTLVLLVLDRVIGSPPAIAADASWRAGLRAWAVAEFDVLARHSWYLEIPMAGPPMGPNNMAWLEAGLATLGRTNLPEQTRFQLVMNLSLYVLGRSWAAKDVVADQGEEYDFEEVMLSVLDPQRFPALVSALAGTALDGDIDWARADFEFGLDRMLDGYERYLAAHGFGAVEDAAAGGPPKS
ncbi:TetR/AcrR family transcriptional regulator [Nocardia higoensis]|uniref:TetR/AcrR family transcriptional regulator n=1 Tax=Nocardia higoensis TaxID=228599 RepID=UPI0002DBE6EC|nr:TetR/AcrR family transcriptional regulator [Nocardia higoensis]